MKVSFRESVEVPADRKYDIFAYAGLLGVYKHGMFMRDAIKALISVKGVSWLSEMLAAYPVNDAFPPRPPRIKKASNGSESGGKRRKPKHATEEKPVANAS